MVRNDFLQILFNRARAAIFESLFQDKGDRYHLRELERVSSLNSATLYKELQTLLKINLICRESDGNRVYYYANKSHPCYPEIRGIVRKMAGWIEQLRNLFQSLNTVQYAWVFGSYAKGEMHSESDIDLLVVGTISWKELVKVLRPFTDDTQHECNPKLYSMDEWEKANAEKNPFIQRVFKQPMIKLK